MALVIAQMSPYFPLRTYYGVQAMIRIKAFRNRHFRIVGLRVRGHAQYREEGHDIACAAVSALAQTALLGIKKLYGSRARHFIRKGFLEIKIPVSQEAAALEGLFLLETIYEGLIDIAMMYPGYVTLQEVLPDISKNSIGAGEAARQ